MRFQLLDRALYWQGVQLASPYTEAYKAIKSVPILQAATAYDNRDTGKIMILILNKAIWMGDQMRSIDSSIPTNYELTKSQYRTTRSTQHQSLSQLKIMNLLYPFPAKGRSSALQQEPRPTKSSRHVLMSSSRQSTSGIHICGNIPYLVYDRDYI
jgi:hypothetical protein